MSALQKLFEYKANLPIFWTRGTLSTSDNDDNSNLKSEEERITKATCVILSSDGSCYDIELSEISITKDKPVVISAGLSKESESATEILNIAEKALQK